MSRPEPIALRRTCAACGANNTYNFAVLNTHILVCPVCGYLETLIPIPTLGQQAQHGLSIYGIPGNHVNATTQTSSARGTQAGDPASEATTPQTRSDRGSTTSSSEMMDAGNSSETSGRGAGQSGVARSRMSAAERAAYGRGIGVGETMTAAQRAVYVQGIGVGEAKVWRRRDAGDRLCRRGG